MNFRARYVFVVLTFIAALHFLLALTHEGYSRAMSISNIRDKLQNTSSEAKQESSSKNHSTAAVPSATEPATLDDTSNRRANATFVILARNSDIDGIVQSVREVESRFNKEYRYPYVYLNEEPFSEEFQKRVLALTEAGVEFGVIPPEHWYQPDWIDEEKAKTNRDKLEADKVIYGESVSYRNMCRFNSGFFFKNDLLQKYKWYWRIEPSVHFYCDINFDPFLYMEDNNKTYGFTVSLYEFEKTIPTLWQTVTEFTNQYPQYVAEGNSMGFLSEDEGRNYNLCHFWSNFEIADLDFWRGEAYTKFFEYLDSKGGFYYERWGDAPVHSIAVSLFLPKDKIHFFNEVGYFHHPFTHCPSGKVWSEGKCSCNVMMNFDPQGYSCYNKWRRLHS